MSVTQVNEEPVVMGRQQAASLIGISPYTLDKLWRRGKVVSVKVAGCGPRKYRREDILNLLEEA